jgi:glycosyltransferase involved in cell wall biosynthesis
MLEELPRTLIVTPGGFSHVTGGGVTLSSLFADWPKDRLATVYKDHVTPATDVCDTYYRLGREEIRKWGPLEAVRRNLVAKGDDSAGRPESSARGLITTGRQCLFGDGVPETVRLTQELDSWVANFRPDVIYSVLGSNAMIELTDALRVRNGLPLVIHVMDDWPSTIYRGGLLSRFERRRLKRNLGHLLSASTTRLAISDSMVTAYESRYGFSFQAFQNNLDSNDWSGIARIDTTLGTPIKIVYFGSILPFAQLDSLITCCQAIDRLQQDGVAVTLDIFSPSSQSEAYRERLVVADCITLNKAIPDRATYLKKLCGADLLLLPVNFDADTIRYIQYSMPTKVPEYLASGVPILVYGPAQVAQVEYAEQAKWGYVVTEPGVEQVELGLRRLIEDIELRARLSRTARRIATERHDAEIVRRDFEAALRRAAGMEERVGNPGDQQSR